MPAEARIVAPAIFAGSGPNARMLFRQMTAALRRQLALFALQTLEYRILIGDTGAQLLPVTTTIAPVAGAQRRFAWKQCNRKQRDQN